MTTDKTEVQFIANEDGWPNWPVLPIKRWVNNTQEVAFVFALGAKRPKLQVIFANMWTFSNMTQDQRMACRMEVYDNAAALVEDGWRVD